MSNKIVKEGKRVKYYQSQIDQFNSDFKSLKQERDWSLQEVEDYKAVLLILIEVVQGNDIEWHKRDLCNKFLKAHFEGCPELFKLEKIKEDLKPVQLVRDH